jgi:hypothetical protein
MPAIPVTNHKYLPDFKALASNNTIGLPLKACG